MSSVIFGVGDWGKWFKRCLENYFGMDICAIVTNRKHKWGEKIDDVEISSPQRLVGMNFEKVFVCALKESSCSEMETQLINIGIPREKIEFMKTSAEYIKVLDAYKKHDVAVYGGYLDDESKLLQSASGGIATALTEHMLEQGGFVAGVAYSRDFYSAEYIIIHDKSDVDRLKGSKYIDCDKKDIYAKVKKLVESGEKVLFFGLPCVVAALYKMIGSRPKNLLTCELVCYGPTSSKIHKEYVTYLESKYKSKVIDFSVKYKKEAWTPSYLHAEFNNGQVFENPFYETEYGYAFSVFGREACYRCMFKGNNRQGDIMIGDFWGASDKDEYWNRYGVSSIFAETDKGNDFLQSTSGIKLFPTTFVKAVENNYMVVGPKHRRGEREKFSELLSEKGLIYAAKHSIGFRSKKELG